MKIKTILLLFLMASFCSAIGQPKNLDECNAYFDKTLKAGDISFIKKLAIDELSTLHMSMGLNIRNEWIRGNRNPDLVSYFHNIGFFHPDDISGIIIKNYWCYLNKAAFDLQSEVKRIEEYWEKAAEARKKDKENLANNEKKLTESFIDIRYRPTDAPVLALPQHQTGNGIFSDEFIKYRDGYIINSLSTAPGGGEIDVAYKYHYLDLKTNKLFKLSFEEFDTVLSIITIDSALYVAGNKNHRLKIVVRVNGRVAAVPNAVSDPDIKELRNECWIKLGVYNGRLYALQTNGLYMFDGNMWQLKNKFSFTEYFKTNYSDSVPILPTENIVLTGKKMYFLREILQGRDCELFEFDLEANTLSEFWQSNMLVDNYAKEINSYSIFGSDTLFVCTQRVDRTMLLRAVNNTVSLYIWEDKLKSVTGENFKIRIKKIHQHNNKVLLVADNGLFELKNNEINPLAFFTNTEQLIPEGKYNIHFNFEPRSFAVLDESKYLIGGLFGGLYLVDLGLNSIKTLDDNKSMPKMDLLKN